MKMGESFLRKNTALATKRMRMLDEAQVTLWLFRETSRRLLPELRKRKSRAYPDEWIINSFTKELEKLATDWREYLQSLDN